jgi:hypothetical protein
VAPEKQAANSQIGNWAVTEVGDTHFVFAIPDNMTGFTEAKVLLIGRKLGREEGDDVEQSHDEHRGSPRRFRHDLALSLARGGEAQDFFVDTRKGLGPLTWVAWAR